MTSIVTLVNLTDPVALSKCRNAKLDTEFPNTPHATTIPPTTALAPNVQDYESLAPPDVILRPNLLD